ncbi:unnamed protein product [Musa hybrid cultivar]
MTLLPGNHQKQLANSTSCSSWIYQINHLAGQMPRTLRGLCSFTDLRLNSNNFNGELADVVDGWTSPQTHQKATSLKHTFPGSQTWNI